ncbi:FecR domain-containing protein [Dyella sp. C11]|uniref:FecR family protein n=1 Tax=Dyella sp. C11 TaxID=2126991 RepID=UPI000D65B05B|nr:FecR domain-containing protein [Dyella sp. C11]
MMAKNEQNLRVAADWWMRLRDPAATKRTTQQWLAWTDEDASHLDAFERVTELATRLHSLGDVTRERLLAEFAPAQIRSRRAWLPMAAAAAAVLVIAGYVGWHAMSNPATSQSYASAVGAQRSVTLDDGTRVTLGGATRLVTHYSRNRRQVELADGEAYFEVVHDASRPFEVRAGDVTIEDIGTAFNVRRTGQYVTVAMAEGRVRVADNKGGANNSLEAVAGQSVIFDPSRSIMNVVTSDPASAAAWRNARLEFDNEPLSVVVANINRYRAQPLRIADNDLRSLTFTGTVKTDAIDDWLHALPQVLPLQVSEAGGQTVLSDARRTPEPR